MISFYISIFITILNFLLFLNYTKFSKILNLWDEPDQNLKQHKIKAAPIIGIFFYINLIFLFLVDFMTGEIFF